MFSQHQVWLESSDTYPNHGCSSQLVGNAKEMVRCNVHCGTEGMKIPVSQVNLSPSSDWHRAVVCLWNEMYPGKLHIPQHHRSYNMVLSLTTSLHPRHLIVGFCPQPRRSSWSNRNAMEGPGRVPVNQYRGGKWPVCRWFTWIHL